MRGEFYVTQVILWNRQLREAICSMLNLSYRDPAQVLAGFRGDYALMSIAGCLDCDREDVFARIKDRLARGLGILPDMRLVSLGPSDLSLFFDDEFVGLVAGVLECSTSWPEVVERLFDLPRLRRLVEITGISPPGEELPLDRLFWRMISADGVTKLFQHLGGPVDIWSLLTSLVNEKASERLCAKLGCRPEDVFAAIRGTIDWDTAEASPAETFEDQSKKLDMLAVAKLQELLRTVSATFLREATDIAERLSGGLVEAAGVRMLLPLLQFHGRHAYREALQKAAALIQSLGGFGFEPRSLSEQPFGPQIELQATISEVGPQECVLVEFRTPPEVSWHELLRLHGLTQRHREHVKAHLPRRGASLQGLGETLVERVLQCPIPPLPSAERTAWDLMIQADDSLIQYFVLRRRQLPDEHAIGEVVGSKGASNFDVAVGARTVCPTPQELYRRAVDRYRRG